MPKFSAAVCAFLTLVLIYGAAANAQAAEHQARLGMNLNGPADWNSELPFVDVFRLARQWISQKEGAGWGKGPELELDEHGWVKKLEPGCWADTPLCTIDGGHYPSGRYTVLYDGAGEITTWGAATVVVAASTPGRMVLAVDSAKGGFFLQIRQTNPANYIRNIRVLMPDWEKTYQAEPFHPVFLKRWHGVACFRFMDWMATNDSKIVKWEDRPKGDDAATWTVKGIPVEVLIDLCNRQKADAWFCMPHAADDDYVRSFAKLVKTRLDPSLKVYIEYSNEVWNGGFQQHNYAQNKGQELGLGAPTRPWEGACLYYTRRSLEIFKIWRDEFGGADRLVRVLAWQAASDGNYWLDGMLLKGVGPGQVDALAIAPYLTFTPSPGSKPSSDTAAGWTLDQIFAYLENKALPESLGWVRSAAAVAAKHRLRLLAYEAGQHLVGVAGGENNAALTGLFHAANADPRMGRCYQQYLQGWANAGGDLLCNFASTGMWSKWGSWGLLQYYDDNEAASPKFMATMRWAKSQGQPVHVPESGGQTPVAK